MRCYICDFSGACNQSIFNSGLNPSKRKEDNRVRLYDNDQWMCDDCESIVENSVRQSKRLHEPENPDNYRTDILALLKEFKEDLPELYSNLDVDGFPMNPDQVYPIMLDKYANE